MARKKQSRKRVKQNALLVTVDIGKAVHYGYFRTPDGEDIKPFPFQNTYDGFMGFWNKIMQYRDAGGLDGVVFGFESTGPYAEPLTHFMNREGVQLVQVNPMHTKKMKDVVGNSPEKNDAKDPLIIADIIEMGRFLNVIIPRGYAAELRRLTQARESFVQHRTQLYNRIHDRLSIIFPEYGLLDVKTKSAAWLYKNHPTPEKIVSLGYDELFKNLRTVSRGSLKTPKIQALFSAAERSAGVKEGLGAFELELGFLYEQVESIETAVGKVEEEMKAVLEKIPCSKYLLSIHGIGAVIAAMIIGEVGDFRQFRNGREVVKLAGLNLFAISSGKHIGKHRITKRGRGLLRKALYFGVLGMIKPGGPFHERYERYLERGKPKKVAQVILMRKLLVIIFALVRDESHFIQEKGETKRAA